MVIWTIKKTYHGIEYLRNHVFSTDLHCVVTSSRPIKARPKVLKIYIFTYFSSYFTTLACLIIVYTRLFISTKFPRIHARFLLLFSIFSWFSSKKREHSPLDSPNIAISNHFQWFENILTAFNDQISEIWPCYTIIRSYTIIRQVRVRTLIWGYMAIW